MLIYGGDLSDSKIFSSIFLKIKWKDFLLDLIQFTKDGIIYKYNNNEDLILFAYLSENQPEDCRRDSIINLQIVKSKFQILKEGWKTFGSDYKFKF